MAKPFEPWDLVRRLEELFEGRREEVGAVFWLRSCSRCNGDLHEDVDQYGRFIACLQCGHYLTEPEEVVLRYSHAQPEAVTGEAMKELQAAAAA